MTRELLETKLDEVYDRYKVKSKGAVSIKNKEREEVLHYSLSNAEWLYRENKSSFDKDGFAPEHALLYHFKELGFYMPTEPVQTIKVDPSILVQPDNWVIPGPPEDAEFWKKAAKYIHNKYDIDDIESRSEGCDFELKDAFDGEIFTANKFKEELLELDPTNSARWVFGESKEIEIFSSWIGWEVFIHKFDAIRLEKFNKDCIATYYSYIKEAYAS